jgi:glycosyltransferase involved in cell wall biosynthesis
MRIPLIASEHTNFQHYAYKRLQALLLRLVLGLVDLTTCVSEQVRQTYPKSIRKRMVIIPNPVTRDAVVRADVAAKSTRKMLLSVGRLDAGKDHSTLIEAFAKIAAEVSDWDLRIIGEGVLRPKLEAQIAALGLATRISLPGATRDIASAYQDAQLFVMPSRYESFSLTTVERLRTDCQWCPSPIVLQ